MFKERFFLPSGATAGSSRHPFPVMSALVLVAGLVLAACGGGGGDSEDDGDGDGSGGTAVASISITPAEVLLALGTERAVTAIALDADGNVLSQTLEWESSDTSVAITDAGGTRVTGIAVGTATLTASSGSVSATVDVIVVQPGAGMVEAGVTYSCGLTTLGEAWCWGANESAQLGVEIVQEAHGDPQRVQGGLLFKDIAAGNRKTCGLTMEGEAWCWGMTHGGMLGDGGATDENYAATPVRVDTRERFVSIDSHIEQTCGLTAVGTVYCWPYMPEEIWQSDSLDLQVPRSPSLHAAGHVFTQLAVGHRHVCGLTETGAAYCWGSNFDGALGNGSTSPMSSATPLPVAGGHTFKAISAGTMHACALDLDDKAWCWGSNGTGQLGINRPDIDYSATPVAVVNDHSFAKISAGSSTAALDETGNVYWWGAAGWTDCTLTDIMNGGSCTTIERRRDAPQLMNDGSDQYADVSSGMGHTLALTEQGTLAGMHGNTYLQLGNGSTSPFAESLYSGTLTYEVDLSGQVVVEPGTVVSIPVTVRRLGGFTINGPGFNETITLSALNLPAGVSASFSPATLSGGETQSMLTLTAGDDAVAGSTTINVQAAAADSSTRSASFRFAVSLPSTDGEVDLVCETASTPLPYGFHCMNSQGVYAPGKWNIPEMFGTYVDSEIGMCIEWAKYGSATARFRAPEIGGGSTTVQEGQWGVIVRRSGIPEGTDTQWYVYTAPADAQTQLLGYDAATGEIMGWNFVKSSSCPW